MPRAKNHHPKLALIGYGYWGKKVFATLCEFTPWQNIFIVDPFFVGERNQLQFATLAEVLNNHEIEQVLIVTPEETHFELAKACLEHQKNVFVEKPLCLKSDEARQLLKLAKKNNLQLYVDYTFLFDPYVKKIKNLIKAGTIGELLHIESVRYSINISKPNVTVFDDLATHDLYLGRYFFDSVVTGFSSTHERINSTQINQGHIALSFGQKTLSAHYSWVQPVAERKMTFIGTKATIVWDRYSPELFIYKNQQFLKKVTVSTTLPPLKLSIKTFLSEKQTDDYQNDIMVLEKIRSGVG